MVELVKYNEINDFVLFLLFFYNQSLFIFIIIDNYIDVSMDFHIVPFLCQT